MKEIQVLEGETWIPIKGHEQIYQVSCMGRVRGVQGIRKIADNGAGYKNVSLKKKNCKQKVVYLHRLVAQHFILNPNNLPQVNHKDGNKSNNRVSNLEWVSPSQNIKDAHAKGQMVGRTHVSTSIDIKPDEFVIEMYRRYKETGKVGETARAFGVPRTTLSSIVNKKSRVRITDAIDLEFENQNQK